MFKRITIVAFTLLLALSLNSYAQKKTTSLAGKGGLGAQVGGEATLGAHGFFYFSNQMSIGAHFGFLFDGGTDKTPSTTSLVFVPYFNYYLAKLTNKLWFYGQGQFSITTGTKEKYDPNHPNELQTETNTGTAININAGLEWRVTSLTNIYGGVGFINFNLDPSQFKIGVMKPFIGFNWVIF